MVKQTSNVNSYQINVLQMVIIVLQLLYVRKQFSRLVA